MATLYLSSIYRKAVLGWILVCIVAVIWLADRVRIVQYQNGVEAYVLAVEESRGVCDRLNRATRELAVSCAILADSYSAHMEKDVHSSCPLMAGWDNE